MKRIINIRKAGYILIMCMLLCGCKTDKDVIVIGSAGACETESDGSMQTGSEQEEAALIQVYVCGAVVKPGVVAVPEGSRVEAALEAAGGFAADAARDAVNLADWVTDGQMLYFPTKEEEKEDKKREASEASGLVNINTADVAQLCTLPGIGESRAADIIAYREKNGDFKNCEDIMNVSGIKTSVYQKLSDKITVE